MSEADAELPRFVCIAPCPFLAGLHFFMFAKGLGLWTPSLGSIYQILQRTGTDISELSPVSSWWPAPDINETIPLPEQEKIDELIKKKEEEQNNNEDTTSYLAYATNGVLVLLDVPLVAGHSLIAQLGTLDSPDGTGDHKYKTYT